MHSANRAKQRLRTSSAAAAAPPADESSKKIELNKTKNSKFNSNIVNNNNSNVNSFAARISDSRRSKSCERKSVSGSRRSAARREILQSPKPIRSAGQASAYEDHLHHGGMIPSPVTAATVVTPGPGSDSGLSGLDQPDTKRLTRSTTPKTSSNSKASSPEIGCENSIVDSGRRSQSLEILSDDLRSLTLSTTSTPSSPSPRPSLAASNLSDVEKIRQIGSAGNGSRDRGGHVQFVPGNRNHSNSNAQIVQSRNGESDLELGALQKSTSIPVHLSVSRTNEVGLPFSLRPHHHPTSAAASNGGHQTGLDLHEPDCATQKKWASAQTLPNSSNTSSYSHNNSRHGPPGTPTGETVSSLQKKKYRVLTNGYNSLPRSSSARERLWSGCCPSEAQMVERSRSSASLCSGPHIEASYRRPPSVASSTTSQNRPATGASSRTGNHRQQSKTMNASMSIWQIQSTLKRGEMVQGVLSLGSLGRPSFGSRIQEREEETCICAPVVIGGKNGHMDWRRDRM